MEFNAPGEIRTHGPRIRNPVLYPPELRGHKEYQLVTVSIVPLRVNVVLISVLLVIHNLVDDELNLSFAILD